MNSKTPGGQRPVGTGGALVHETRLQGRDLALVLASLMLTLLLSALDQTIVSTALPTIMTDLNGGNNYTWVVTAYLITSTTTIPIVGKLSDQFGRKWFVMTGVTVFLLGSALSGASQSITQLIIFRGLQGFGAGMIMSQVFTLIGDIFTPAERARWQGLFSGVFALASVIGPTLGGWISDNTSWRWVFYVNLPLGVVALALLLFFLPNHISARTSQLRGWAALRRIDVAGSLTAAGGTVLLLLGLTWGGLTYAWNSPQVIGALSVAIVLFVAFVVIERSYAVEPILPLDLFKNQVFAAGALLSLTVGMALFMVVFYLPYFIQGVLGDSATSSGAAITPLTLTMALGAAVIGQVIARIGRYQFLSVIGALVMAAGVFLLARMGPTTSLATVTRNMVVVGLGLGMLQPVLTLAVQNAIPRTRLGVGTGAVTYLRALGQTLGVAIIGAVVNNVYSSELARRLPAAAGKLPASVLSLATNQDVLNDPALQRRITDRVAAAAASSAPPHQAAAATAQVHALFAQIFETARLAFATGIQHAFVGGLGVCAAVFVVTLFLKDVPLAQRASQSSHASPNGASPVAEPAEGVVILGH